jgi:large subunit ribosomal protein L18
MANIKTQNNKKTEGRLRRHARVRSKIFGTEERPRLAVFKSNKFIYVQAIDDNLGKTIASASSLKIKSGTMMEKALKVGEEVGKALKTKGVSKVIFDRGGFLYAGHVKALAEGARGTGLEF